MRSPSYGTPELKPPIKHLEHFHPNIRYLRAVGLIPTHISRKVLSCCYVPAFTSHSYYISNASVQGSTHSCSVCKRLKGCERPLETSKLRTIKERKHQLCEVSGKVIVRLTRGRSKRLPPQLHQGKHHSSPLQAVAPSMIRAVVELQGLEQPRHREGDKRSVDITTYDLGDVR